MKPVLALLLTLALASCASTKPLEARHLPFHVAVVPMHEPAVGSVSQGELPGKPTDLRLHLEPREVMEAVGAALHEYCFVEVSLLDDSDLGEGVGSFERQRIIEQRAHEVGADLVVELSLRYDAEIYRKNSSIFWLNYPLFLFAGPSNWFVGDNLYFADVELTTAIYDLNVLQAGDLDVGDTAAQVVAASSRYSGTDLDFVDRSDGIRDYMLGILIPSGYLSRESESAEKKIHDHVLEELRSLVVRGVQSRQRDLVRAEWIAPLYVDPGECSLVREGDEVAVRGRVRLRRGSLAERVRELRLEAGGPLVSVPPLATYARVEDGSEYEFVEFEARVPVAEGADKLRVRCEAGTRDRFVRSYTFDLPPVR